MKKCYNIKLLPIVIAIMITTSLGLTSCSKDGGGGSQVESNNPSSSQACDDSQADVEFPELLKLVKGEAEIFSEFEAGLEANMEKLVDTGEYDGGGEIFRYKDESKEHIMLFFEKRLEDKRMFSSLGATSGDFAGVSIGVTSMGEVVEALGPPTVYENESDIYGKPMAMYSSDLGTLWLHADENHTILSVSYKMCD